MTKARMMEVKGKVLKHLLSGLGELGDLGVDLPKELLAALGQDKNRREVEVGIVSDGLLEKFVRNMEQREEAEIKLQRESDDWHREFERKTEAAEREAGKRHTLTWAELYAELGIDKDDTRRFSINKKSGIVSEVFIDDENKEEEGSQVIDFRPNVH